MDFKCLAYLQHVILYTYETKQLKNTKLRENLKGVRLSKTNQLQKSKRGAGVHQVDTLQIRWPGSPALCMVPKPTRNVT